MITAVWTCRQAVPAHDGCLGQGAEQGQLDSSPLRPADQPHALRCHDAGVTAHATITQLVPAAVEDTFDLVHDYPARLTWDTLLREAYTVDGAAPAKGVEAVCSARWRLGGLSFRTRYVTFRRPDLAAVVLMSRPLFFDTWAASIRHRPVAAVDGRPQSEVVYTLTFTVRPAVVRRVVEPVALAAFRWETRRRLRALAAHLGRRAPSPTA